MKKKLYLRIQAFVLMLLIMLTTFAIAPRQILAGTEFATDEDVTATVSNPEEQNNLEQPANQEGSETVPEITDGPLEQTADSSNETEIDSIGLLSESELESIDKAGDSATPEATLEAGQVTEDDVTDKADDQDVKFSESDLAEYSRGTRAYTPDEYFYFDVETGTITGYREAGPKQVNIPPTINYTKVRCIGENAFSGCKLTSVAIPDTVMFIRQNAFKNNQLTSITIPGSVIQIGNRAFYSTQLKKVTISNGVRFIDSEAFYGNYLKSVIIPNSVESIGIGAFVHNPIIEVSIPDSIKFIVDEDHIALVDNPSIVQVGDYCFNTGIPITGKHYIEAGSLIKDSPFSNNILEELWRPLYVTGTIVEFWVDELMTYEYFLEFTYKGKIAYVAKNAVEKKNPPMTGYAKQTLNLRNTPGGSIIGTIPIGRKVEGVLAKNMVKTTYNGKTGYVYASLLQKDPVKVNRYIVANSIIRSSPNGSVITKLWRPIRVTGTIQGAWLKFTYNKRTAYVAMSVTRTSNPPMTGYAKQTLNLRNIPKGSIIGKISLGRKVSGVLVGNMVKTTYNGKTGYVYATLLQKNPVRVTRYVVANAIIRSRPNGSIIARPWRPIRVTGTIQGAWLRFTYNKKTAYVAMVSTRIKNPPMTGYAKQTLNVRNTPKGPIIGRIPRGRKVSGVLVGNMVKTTYNGKTSYVYGTLLQKNPVR